MKKKKSTDSLTICSLFICDSDNKDEPKVRTTEKARPTDADVEAWRKRYDELLTGSVEDIVERFQSLDKSGLSSYEIEDSKGRIIQYLLTKQGKVYYSAVDKTCSSMHAQQGTLSADDSRDLIWEGLRKALRGYNPKATNANFSTYAFVCIKNETRTRLKAIYARNASEVSLDAPMGNDDNGDKEMTMLDKIASERHDPEVERRQKQLENCMHKILAHLDPQTRFSLVNYYGLLGAPMMTEAEIGDFMGMSQASVSKKISDGVLYLAQHVTPDERDMIKMTLQK